MYNSLSCSFVKYVNNRRVFCDVQPFFLDLSLVASLHFILWAYFDGTCFAEKFGFGASNKYFCLGQESTGI